MDISLLVNVTTRAWSLDILRLLSKGHPGRQAALISACGAGRTAFAQSLAHLIKLELVERNPGHGHPLRPEFRITPRGEKIAALAGAIGEVACPPAENALLRRAWTLPILAVSRSPRFFTEIKAELAPITDRALSQSLKALELQSWLTRRTMTDMRPPRPIYQASETGAQLAAAVHRSLGA